MDSPITSALMIALMGMTLLFLSLILFYGLLSLLNAVVKDRPASDRRRKGEERTEDRDVKSRGEEVLRAAAIAVALARAEAEARPGPMLAGVAGRAGAKRASSPWWSLHHQRRLGPNPGPRRVR